MNTKMIKMVRKYETEYGVLYLADSRRLLEFVDENSVDLVYTDPPYGIDYEKYGVAINRGEKVVHFGKEDGAKWTKSFPMWAISLWKEVLKNNRWGIVWLGTPVYGMVREEIENVGLNVRNTLIWYKKGVGFTPRPNFKNAFEMAIAFTKGGMAEKWRGGSRTINVFEENIIAGNTKEYYEAGGHPSIKPLSLVMKHIPLFTDENDIVLDMFAGSGTTLIACEKLKRKWIGFEIEEKWFNVAVKRLKKVRNRRLDEWF